MCGSELIALSDAMERLKELRSELRLIGISVVGGEFQPCVVWQQECCQVHCKCCDGAQQEA